VALLKPNEMRSLLKIGHFFNKRGLFNKGVSEAIDKWKRGDSSGRASDVFIKSGKWIKVCTKFYDKITKLLSETKKEVFIFLFTA
jgi:hypothetical protein